MSNEQNKEEVGPTALFGGFDPEESDLLTMNGYDDCIVGVCYSKPKVLERLMADGMTEDEAVEFWSFNQIGAWVGENTPCFLTPNNSDQP